MQVVGEADSGPEAVRKARWLLPDIVLLDLAMPGGGGLTVIKKIREASPHSRVLVLTMHEEFAYVRTVLASGASGYMVKTCRNRASCQRRGGPARPDLCRLQPHPFPGAVGPGSEGGYSGGGRRPEQSPERARCEVLELLVHGYTNPEVAGKLFLSPKTVEAHRSRLAHKLGLRNVPISFVMRSRRASSA